MDQSKFQEFLKAVYAEADREVDSIGVPSGPREEVDLCLKWRFARQAEGRGGLGSFERDGSLGSQVEPRFRTAVNAAYDDSSWQRVNLPHTWNANDTEDTGPGYWRGIGWYRKRFRIDPKCRAKAVRLRIGGANQRSIIWLNGRKVGEHRGGYEGFEFDITDNLRWGRKPNVLAIRVDNLYDPDVAPTVKTDIFWYGGIYRDVTLIVTGRPYFTKAHFICTGLENGKPEIRLDVGLSGKVNADVEATLLDAEGAAVGRCKGKVTKGASLINGPAISRPRLWSPEDPYLYKLALKLTAGRRICDELAVPVGFRWYKFDPDKGFSLNGVPRKLHGVCWHQVYPGLGNALPRSRHRRDMEVIRRMGADFLRTSHYPHHDEIMRAADELGIMVLEELPVMKEIGDPKAYTANILQRLEETVMHHFNHPSIILWGLAGEVNAPSETCYAVAKACAGRFRELDPTRPIAMHAPRGKAIAELFDVAGYSLRGSEQAKDEQTLAHREHRRSPGLAIMDTEYNMGHYCRGVLGGGPNSEELGCDRHEDYLGRINEVAWYCGGAIWHAFDYHGETYDMIIPRVVGSGVTDVWRIPKDSYYFYQSQWSDAPMLHVCGHWTWPGQEGEPRKVRVYSNGKKVELFLNGRLIGAQDARQGERLRHPPFFFDTAYEPGVLKAVAHFDGREPIIEEVHTAGKPYALELATSASEIRYDDFDAHAEITLRVLDRDGHLVPDAAIPVTFYLDGPGKLATQTWPPFGTGTSWYTLAGMTRILWRPDGFPGTVTVKAYSPGLLQGRLQMLAVCPGVDLMQFREFAHGD
ncbi:MAG: glycoside hydrolase family 2 TIM barrel-domain containing protein [Phycisphaerae bacterium]